METAGSAYSVWMHRPSGNGKKGAGRGQFRYIVVESIPGWLQKGVGYFRKRLSREERMVQEAAQVRLLTVWRIIFRYLYVGSASRVLFRVAWNTKQGLVSSLLRSDIKVEDAMEVVDQYGFEGYLLSALVFHECPRLLAWRNIYTWILVTYLHDMVFVFTTPRLTNRTAIVIIVQSPISTHCWNRYFIFSLNASWTVLVCFVNPDGYARQVLHVFLLFGITLGQSLYIRLRQKEYVLPHSKPPTRSCRTACAMPWRT